jgi:hypothetical protein
MTLPATAAEVLSEHVLFEIESIDRMFLNLYQPRLRHGAGIAAFFVGHRGNRFASSALMAPMTAAFTADIRHFIDARGLDLVRFAPGQSKDDVTQSRLRDAAPGDRGLVPGQVLHAGSRRRSRRCSGLAQLTDPHAHLPGCRHPRSFPCVEEPR